MKNLWRSIKITLAFCVVLTVGYIAVLWIVALVATPNEGQARTVVLNEKIVGADNVGQNFSDPRYFWGRPSAVEYDGGGSGGSNKGTTNPEYLAEVEQRIDDFLLAHPYLSRQEIPSEMVTASGSGLDPNISPLGARVQVQRVADARGMNIAVVQKLVDSVTEQGWLGLFGTRKVNVLRLNVALESIQPNVTLTENNQ